MSEHELGEILRTYGVVDSEQLAQALGYLAHNPKVTFGRALEALGIAEETAIVKLLCRHFNLPYVNLVSVTIPSEVIALIPRELARRHEVVPFRLHGNVLIFATIDPWMEHSSVDSHVEYEVSFALTDSSSLTDALGKYY